MYPRWKKNVPWYRHHSGINKCNWITARRKTDKKTRLAVSRFSDKKNKAIQLEHYIEEELSILQKKIFKSMKILNFDPNVVLNRKFDLL